MSFLRSSPLRMALVLLPPLRRKTSNVAKCLSRPCSTMSKVSSNVIRSPLSLQSLPSSSPSSTQHLSVSASDTSAGLLDLPYHVQRTASQELPVYQLAKRGGNLHQTRIRKIRGDIAALRDQLQSSLKLKRQDATINQLTGHIILKGWYKDEVKRFLEQRFF